MKRIVILLLVMLHVQTGKAQAPVFSLGVEFTPTLGFENTTSTHGNVKPLQENNFAYGGGINTTVHLSNRLGIAPYANIHSKYMSFKQIG